MLVEQVRQQSGLDHKGDFSVSNTGVLIYRGNGGAETRLVWRDRAGRQQVLTERPAMYCEPTMSPDEERIAVDIFDPQPSETSGFGVARITSDIWVMGRSSDVSSRFTFEPAADFDPVWSPDGTRIAFSSARRGVLDLYQKSVDGDGDDELLLASSDAKHLQAWSPDGRYLLYGIFDRTTRGDLWLLPIAGDRTPIALLQTPASEEQAQISPDGRWFAYTSDESGRSEVYVRSFPKPARKWQISTNGGGDGRWRPDGKELYYIADDRRLMAVAVKTGATSRRALPCLCSTRAWGHTGARRETTTM